MKRYLDIYIEFIKQYVKILMQSRVNFFIGIINIIFTQVAGILFLSIIFKKIPTLNGWTYNQILFIYGFSQLPRGLDHLYSDNLWFFSQNTIIDGEFDRYLLRPLNPLFQIIAEKLQLDSIGEIITGVSIVGYSIVKLNIYMSFFKVLTLVILVISGAIIYTSIKLLFASLSFWIKESFSILNIVYMFSDFAKYPISVYGKWLQFILVLVIPFAFTAFIPASYLLGNGNFFYGVSCTIIVAVIMAILSYSIWNRGMKVYESSGN